MISASDRPGPGDWREANRAMWDERVPIHLASDFYDLDGFRVSQDALRGFEIDEVGEVSGKRLLHLQCHLGTDALSWARRGAAVTGLDFSGTAVTAVRALASQLGWDEQRARFVQADVYDAQAALDGRNYDIVYTGLGALNWLPDLPRWAQTAASLLVPGGFCYLAEFHPVGLCLGPDGAAFAADYFQREPIVVDGPGTYADPAARTRHNHSVEWQHPLGDVVSAVAAAGLRLEFLHEFDFTLAGHVQGMVKGPDDSGPGGGSGTVFRLPQGLPACRCCIRCGQYGTDQGGTAGLALWQGESHLGRVRLHRPRPVPNEVTDLSGYPRVTASIGVSPLDRARIGHAHGSGGRRHDLANLCRRPRGPETR